VGHARLSGVGNPANWMENGTQSRGFASPAHAGFAFVCRCRLDTPARPPASSALIMVRPQPSRGCPMVPAPMGEGPGPGRLGYWPARHQTDCIRPYPVDDHGARPIPQFQSDRTRPYRGGPRPYGASNRASTERSRVALSLIYRLPTPTNKRGARVIGAAVRAVTTKWLEGSCASPRTEELRPQPYRPRLRMKLRTLFTYELRTAN
jgi:hypothetical protein